jgi:hypothetical protein
MLSTWTREELCKPIKGRNQKEHSMEEKEKLKERMRKKFEEIHVED